MNQTRLNSLGSEIESRYRAANYDDKKFPRIAEDALLGFEFEYEYDVEKIANLYNKLPIGSHPKFSDLALAVFKASDFYIELLHWTKASTSIHQHAFSGAFKVVKGGSVRAKYTFAEQERVSNDLLIGDVECEEVEVLSLNDVRKIMPGSETIHSLYHLESPSVTLVVRTHGHSENAPQYSFIYPYFALDQFRKDVMIDFYLGLLNFTKQQNDKKYLRLLNKQVAQLDFSRLVSIMLTVGAGIQQKDLRWFYDAAKKYHDHDWVDKLEIVIERRGIEGKLKQFRRMCEDKELRFFVALLLNTRNRKDLFLLMANRYPDERPEEKCVHFLYKLWNYSGVLATNLFASSQWAGINRYGLVAEIIRVVPKEMEETSVLEFFRESLNCVGDRKVSSKWGDAIGELGAIPELSAVFN